MAFSVTIGSAARSAPPLARPVLVVVVTSAPHAGVVSTSLRAPTRVSPTVSMASTSIMVCFPTGHTGCALKMDGTSESKKKKKKPLQKCHNSA